MSLLHRFSERLAGLADELTLPPRAHELLAEAAEALDAGTPQRTLELLDRIDAIQPRVAAALVLRGAALRALRRPDEARLALLRSIEVRETSRARRMLGLLAEEQGDIATARAQLQRALDLATADADRLGALDALARLHEEAGDPPRAIPLLRQAMRLDADNPVLSRRLAEALEADGEAEAAWKASAPALEADAADTQALLLGARLATRLPEAGLGEALRLLDRVPATEREQPAVVAAHARLLLHKGDATAARELLIGGLQRADAAAEQIMLLTLIASCDEARGEPTLARDTLRQAVHLGATAPTIVALSRLELQTGAPMQARERLQQLEPDAVDRRVRRTLLGRAALALGDIEQARELLAPLRGARMEAEVVLALGQLALAQRDPVEALSLLREAAHHPEWRSAAEASIAQAMQALAPRLPIPESAEAPTAASLARLLDVLAPVLGAHPLLSDLLPRLTGLRQQLDSPLVVAILGEFNSGKSTVINAFVAEDMVATGVLPTTCHVNAIRYGPRPVARWTRHDGGVEELPFSEASTLVRQRPDEIAALEFLYPHPELRSIHFWDTPGFNAPDDAHEHRAGEALQSADAIVWILDAQQALTATEFDRIRTVPRAHERLLVLLNKTDRLGDPPDDAVREILRHLEAHLGADCAGIFPLSARDALEARRTALREGAPVEHADRAWSAFENALRDRFFARAGDLKAREAAGGLIALATETLDIARDAAATIADVRAAVAGVHDELQRRAARWEESSLTPARRALREDLQRLRTRTVAEIADLVGPSTSLLPRRRLAGEDLRLLANQLRDRNTHAHRAALERLGEEGRKVEALVVRAVEDAAARIGPPEGRTLRRRLDAWLAEAAMLERLLEELLVHAPVERLRARLDAHGDRVLEEIAAATGRPESEREHLLRQLIPEHDDLHRERIVAWGQEFIATAGRLCQHVDRDLDLLSLDIDQRIVQPFAATRDALEAACSVPGPT